MHRAFQTGVVELVQPVGITTIWGIISIKGIIAKTQDRRKRYTTQKKTGQNSRGASHDTNTMNEMMTLFKIKLDQWGNKVPQLT